MLESKICEKIFANTLIPYTFGRGLSWTK